MMRSKQALSWTLGFSGLGVVLLWSEGLPWWLTVAGVVLLAAAGAVAWQASLRDDAALFTLSALLGLVAFVGWPRPAFRLLGRVGWACCLLLWSAGAAVYAARAWRTIRRPAAAVFGLLAIYLFALAVDWLGAPSPNWLWEALRWGSVACSAVSLLLAVLATRQRVLRGLLLTVILAPALAVGLAALLMATSHCDDEYCIGLALAGIAFGGLAGLVIALVATPLLGRLGTRLLRRDQQAAAPPP